MDDSSSSYRFFQNRACAHFPCHQGIGEQEFNCLFCFCPLYALGRRCGGSFSYTAQGVKDCSACTFPHHAGNYNQILARFDDIADIVKAIDNL